ncbi:hypothetical protein COY27_06580 [Candidatus Woesearchaeota archaeon CG_4_10_14_0_2_um_filter_33_13]|nr:MAG: hypothetical protein COY27_06580 [Candidatus Woesearchaeota archaeon CG_4_10_14_0_2_um_filter_33_13]
MKLIKSIFFALIILIIVVLILITLIPETKTIYPASSSGSIKTNFISVAELFNNLDYYQNKEIIVKGYVLNVLDYCKASTMECWGKPVLSTDVETNYTQQLQLRNTNGQLLDGCTSTKEPCQGFVNAKIYEINGILIKTEPQMINGKSNLNIYALKINSFKEITS